MPENSDFGTFGRYVETPVDQMPPDMKDAYDFTMKLRRVVPGPHKIWVNNPALSRTVMPTGLGHESMGYFPSELKPEQPGVNGVRFAAKTSHLYYSATAKKLFMRVPVDPNTHEAAGEPELVVAGKMGDDFCIDEDNEMMGAATYMAEWQVPELTYGAVLDSAIARGTIRAIDAKAALAATGVLAVVTHENAPRLKRFSFGLAFPRGQGASGGGRSFGALTRLLRMTDKEDEADSKENRSKHVQPNKSV